MGNVCNGGMFERHGGLHQGGRKSVRRGRRDTSLVAAPSGPCSTESASAGGDRGQASGLRTLGRAIALYG